MDQNQLLMDTSWEIPFAFDVLLGRFPRVESYIISSFICIQNFQSLSSAGYFIFQNDFRTQNHFLCHSLCAKYTKVYFLDNAQTHFFFFFLLQAVDCMKEIVNLVPLLASFFWADTDKIVEEGRTFLIVVAIIVQVITAQAGVIVWSQNL